VPRALQAHLQHKQRPRSAGSPASHLSDGGETGDGADETVNSVYVYEPQVDAWTQLASMGTARRAHASAAVGGKLYVFGGVGAMASHLSTAEVYDPASDSWAPVTSLTSARSSLVAVAL